MKILVLFISITSTILIYASQFAGQVSKVSDGDTIWVTSKSDREKVRLDRIDAPESNQVYGKKAAAALSGMIYGKSVKVEWKKRDQYGRIIGIVYLDGEDINLKMVRDGHAWHYAYFDKTPEYVEAEKEARAAKRGLWKDSNPINPYHWRKGLKSSKSNLQ